MAETFTVTAPNFRGLTRFKSAAVKKKASQTFKAHTLITVSSGLASDFAAGASAVGLCVAGTDASNDEAPSGSPNEALVDCYLLDDVLVEINLVGTLAAADVGAEFGLDVSNSQVSIKKSDTTNKRVRVVSILEGAVGDTNARVLARFLLANIL